MLVRVDPKNYQITLVTVTRDTEAKINGEVTKINEAYHVGGIKSAVSQVESLAGVSVKYYFDMNFVQFEKFVNALSGIKANVPIDMSMKDIVSGNKIALVSGVQDLDGAQSLVLARMRKAYAGDIEACRQIQDRQIVEVAIRQVSADPANAAVHVNALIENVETNWPVDELMNMVSDFADNASKIEILSGTGPYAGGFMEQYDGLWLVPRDETAWKEVMTVVDRGEDPTAVVPLPKVSPAQ